MPNTNAKRDDNSVPVALAVNSSTGFTQPLQVDSLGRLLLSATSSGSSTTSRFTLPLVTGAGNVTGTVFAGASAVGNLIGTYGTNIATGTDSNAGEGLAFFCVVASSSMKFYDYSPEFQTLATLTTSTANAFISFIGVTQNTFPATATGAMTSKHFGFILDTTVLNASIANGTSQTLVDISSGITMTTGHIFRAIMNGTTNCKFYIDNVLKATITTNLPSGSFASNTVFALSIQNDAGVTTDRTITIGNPTFLCNAE